MLLILDWPIGQAEIYRDRRPANRAKVVHGHTPETSSARRNLMRILFVHPSPLMYSEIYLRLEPLGMERVAAATRAAGHDVRILDLQIFKHRDLFAELELLDPPRSASRLTTSPTCPR